MELLPSQIKASPKKAVRIAKPSVTGKTLPIRTVRIERSYGGEFIFEAVDVPGIVEYLDRTREWFATQPQVLSSSSDGALERGLRELTDFSQMVSFEWPAPPAALEMRYELGKRQQSPPPVVGDDYAAIAGIERRGVSSFVLRARTEELYATERGVAIVHREETHVAEVEMRPLSYSGVTLDPITSGELVEVRSAAARMSAVVEDVLDILVSNSIENQPDHDGYYSLDPLILRWS